MVSLDDLALALGVSSNELTSDAITADYRIFQRRRGHRYSLDDLATAAEAVRAAPSRGGAYLDLGCGIGSVLLMASWKLRPPLVYGIEAQSTSLRMAAASVAFNQLDAHLIEGDHREVTRHGDTLPAFSLVTGTPPYLPQGTALESPDPQRAAARIELRGGVEDYLGSAAAVLATDGVVVVCADGRRPERVLDGADRAGLHPVRCIEVWPRPAAEQPLFSVWTLTREPKGGLQTTAVRVRGEDGEQTAEARAWRRLFGL